MLELIQGTVQYVAKTLAKNAVFLTIGILVASALKVYIDPSRLRTWLISKSGVSIPGSVAFGAFTPF